MREALGVKALGGGAEGPPEYAEGITDDSEGLRGTSYPGTAK
ncbi:hypothetical protein OP10G_3828 [Fimbriimonas ginsengisoli Gsoil 348]|uniref:Uncharacterized protein n=1 Tax=Fimbriimonas ginsengisoli Gsoil 348 TaxID=661478 RepID=A0A068NUS5_FIMGI|nr:hypothetical protein OP10G_3828 [Fimbriimonas ginsengisoli Gsoil 348]